MRKFLFIITFCIIAKLSFPVTIYLREVGYAHGNFVELGEVAFISGSSSKAMRKKWKSIVLGKTRKRPQMLTSSKIKQLIDASLLTTKSYTIIGNKTKVVTPYTKITQFEIEMEIKRAVRKLFPTDWKRTFLIFDRDTGDVDVPLGNYRILVDIKNSDVLYGRKQILVRVFIDDRIYVKKRTSVIIQGRVKVLFARRAIYPGRPVYRGNIRYNEIVLQKNLSNFIFSARELSGYVAKKYIPQGGPILRSALKKKILVNNGQEIEIVYKKYSVVVFAEGKAIGNGGLGDIIKVKSKFNNKVFAARVIGSGRVRVIR